MSLQPLDVDTLAEVAPDLERARKMLGFIPNSLLIMARRPGLLRAFGQLAGEVFAGADLDRDLKDMIAHVASAAAGCVYCQAHTASKLAGSEMAKGKLASVWEFEQSALFDDAEKSALRLARDAAVVPNAVTGDHFEDLQRFYSEEQIIDIVGIVGLFGFLNRWNDTLATPLEDAPARFAEEVLSGRGWSIGKHTDERSGDG